MPGDFHLRRMLQPVPSLLSCKILERRRASRRVLQVFYFMKYSAINQTVPSIPPAQQRTPEPEERVLVWASSQPGARNTWRNVRYFIYIPLRAVVAGEGSFLGHKFTSSRAWSSHKNWTYRDLETSRVFDRNGVRYHKEENGCAL